MDQVKVHEIKSLQNFNFFIIVFQDDTYTESYISTIGVDFVSLLILNFSYVFNFFLVTLGTIFLYIHRDFFLSTI